MIQKSGNRNVSDIKLNKLETPLVSVVLPIYNVSDYLSECLDSVINQTYRNLEIICVDDGSTDNCLDIIKRYSVKDDRIVILEKKNGGLSSARNFGLKKAKGEYVYFLDSDDKISDDYIYNMIDALFKSGRDFDIICNTTITKIWDDCKTKKNKVYLDNGVFNYISILGRKGYPFSVWSKIYKTSFLKQNNLSFKEGVIFEDFEFAYKILPFVNDVLIVNKGEYFYRQRSTSIFGGVRLKGDKNSDFAIVFAEVYVNLKKYNMLQYMPNIKSVIKYFNRVDDSLKHKFFNVAVNAFKVVDDEFIDYVSAKERKAYSAIKSDDYLTFLKLSKTFKQKVKSFIIFLLGG